MLNNIYAPLSGALAQEKVLDIIANNLANLNTVGFKGESVTFKLLPPEPEKNYVDPLPPANYKIPFEEILPLRGNEMSYVGVSGVVRDKSQGTVIETKNPLDVMVEGDGYIGVNTKQGIRYTRNGSLSMNSNGNLVDFLGNPIIGEQGNILIAGKNIEINPLGEVYQDGEYVDRIQLYTTPDEAQMEKVGTNYYIFNGNQDDMTTVENPTMRQGYLEGSNVNAIKSLTNMILAHRSYEAYQKAVKNMDSMMDKSANSIGQLSG